MRSPIYVYDDARARMFEPFALTRPAGSLTAGCCEIWGRWQIALQSPIGGFVGAPHLDGFDAGWVHGLGTAPRMATGEIPAGAIIASSRFAPSLEIHALRGVDPKRARSDWWPADSVRRWRAGGQVAAVRTDRALRVEELRGEVPELETLGAGGGSEEALRGWWMEDVWDLVRLLPEILADDLAVIPGGPLGEGASRDYEPPPAHATVLGAHPVLLERADPRRGGTATTATVIEPHVIFDATSGPILVSGGAHLHAFTRISGPCFIGADATVMGGDISSCSIGPVCKVRGEMSTTVMAGYANKGHDGFVGHSYLGHWTNLGAGTITSNLKNTYGSVAMWTPGGTRDTGMQFLGTLFGDHAKTGIGTRLTTGTVLGAGANVYGSAMPPKCVPPFSWGERPPYAEYRLDKFLDVAEKVMARRKRTMSAECRRQLAAAYAARWTVDGRSET